jgi:hypothetical protein
MDGYHPWNFIPLDHTDLNFANPDISATEGRISTPSFDFESDVDNVGYYEDDLSTTVHSPGRITASTMETWPISMAAPTRPLRKQKARTLREEDWAPVKARVLELLKDKTLSEVRVRIHAELGFEAT